MILLLDLKKKGEIGNVINLNAELAEMLQSYSANYVFDKTSF